MSQSEQWDDGNDINGDGCSSTCLIETGYTWSGSPSVWQKCGNGKKEGTEGWDDGNIDIIFIRLLNNNFFLAIIGLFD